MTDAPPMSPTAPGSRLVTVDDLRYELQRERAITDAHFIRITSHIESLDRRFASVDARFDQVDARFDQVDARFDRLEARFDSLEERLRFNKTLIVASLSAVASVASVVVSLLK
jgi:uncharacterized protein YdcH (DUF465 family)